MTPANIHFLIILGFILLLILGVLAIVAAVTITAHRYEHLNKQQALDKMTGENIIKEWVADGRKESDYQEGGPSPFL